MTIQIKDLSVVYKNKGVQDKALKEVNVEIQTGEFVGILGRSGAGKSTFIRCINQLVRPTQGEIMWDGKTITTLKGHELRALRRDIGMIFQQFNLIPRLSVLQNVALGVFGYRPLWKNLVGIISKAEKERALHCLRRVGIEELASKRVDQLSGGQQQRVAIARVMMQQPKILLGDEPVASLDPVTSKQVMDLIKDLHEKEKLTILMNLHDVQIALAYCHRIIGFSQGQLVFDGLPEEVTEEILAQIYA